MDDMYDEEDNPSFFSMKGKTAQKAIVTPLSGNFVISVRINHGSRLSQKRGGFCSCLLIPAHDCKHATSRPNIQHPRPTLHPQVSLELNPET